MVRDLPAAVLIETLVVESNGFNDRTWLDHDGHPHTEGLRTTERYRRRNVGNLDNPRGRRLLAIAVGPCGTVKLPNSPDPFADQDLSRNVFERLTT